MSEQTAEGTSGSERLARHTPGPPARMVHLGLGNFFRAHQAWYTHHANQGKPPEEQWGIVAFTGQSAGVADLLSEQDGLYTLVVDGADGARAEVIESIVGAHPGDDLGAWHACLADPAIAILTTTVTEAGYCADDDNRLDLGDQDVQADLAAYRDGRTGELVTMPVRVASGLAARRAAGAGGLTIVPCDNLPGNGAVARGVVLDAAREIHPELAAWVEEHVGFVTTAVDRITPRPTEDDVRRAEELTGVADPAVVVTEPFAEWDLAGDFVAGRPAWDEVGAVVTDDVRPYETRKLWLLNGAHSLLAYAGSIRGHETVSAAMGDPVVAGWVQEWWDVAIPHLTLPEDQLRAYTVALSDRFANPHIRHLLAQIAADGSQKLPVRIVPALRATLERSGAGAADGALRAVAAWVVHARGAGAPLVDADEARVRGLVAGPVDEAVARVLRSWGVDDEAATARTVELAGELTQA